MSADDLDQDRSRRLERVIDDLGASTAVAVRVIRLVDDQRTSARELCDTIDLDPLLNAQLLRLANSASYGSPHGVGTTARAVSVVGFQNVRSLAAMQLTAATTTSREVPPGFREHAAATASGCVAVSTRFGLARDEAFSMGLLHDIGWPILDGVDANLHRSITVGALDTQTQCAAEVAAFGMSHADAAARVLTMWNFPEPMVRAIRAHHDPVGPSLDDLTVAEQVLISGDAFAHLVLGSAGLGFEMPDFDRLGFTTDVVSLVADLTESHMDDILDSLGH